MKKNTICSFITGFIACYLLIAAPTAIASVKEYILKDSPFPVLVDGQAYEGNLPILNYEGNTYVPLKALGDLLDSKIEFNAELKQVEISKSPSVTPDKEPEEVTNNFVSKVPDSWKRSSDIYQVIDGDEYVWFAMLVGEFGNNSLILSEDNSKLSLVNSNSKIIKDNIPFITHNTRILVSYNSIEKFINRED